MKYDWRTKRRAKFWLSFFLVELTMIILAWYERQRLLPEEIVTLLAFTVPPVGLAHILMFYANKPYCERKHAIRDTRPD